MESAGALAIDPAWGSLGREASDRSKPAWNRFGRGAGAIKAITDAGLEIPAQPDERESSAQPGAEISVRPSLFCFSFIPYPYYFLFLSFINSTTA